MNMALAVGLAALLAAGAARAEVTAVGDNGFRTRNVVEVAASADRVYAALGEVGRWWNGAHSYSGKAGNITLPLKAGACFCETLAGGGGVAHGTVALAWPGRLLRLDAALGPLQDEGAAGALTFEIKPNGDGVELVQTYHVGGLRAATAKAFAPAVDEVVREQLLRLEKFIETGKPD